MLEDEQGEEDMGVREDGEGGAERGPRWRSAKGGVRHVTVPDECRSQVACPDSNWQAVEGG